MVSKNRTLRCAASVKYSIAGANRPNGLNAWVELGGERVGDVAMACSRMFGQPIWLSYQRPPPLFLISLTRRYGAMLAGILCRFKDREDARQFHKMHNC